MKLYEKVIAVEEGKKSLSMGKFIDNINRPIFVTVQLGDRQPCDIIFLGNELFLE